MPAPHRVIAVVAACAAAVAVAAGPVGAATPRHGYAGSFAAPTAPDDPSPAASCGTSRPSDWAAREESRRGTSAWQAAGKPGAVSGWADTTTAVCGQTVGLHLSGSGPAVVSAYRVGWYAGKGARLVWTSGAVPVSPRPAAEADAHGTVETSWPTSLSVTLTSDWTPGLYVLVARPARQPRATGAAIPLVVRHPGAARLLAVASTLTWQAYNPYGGRSLYIGPDGTSPSRARVVSFDRPYTTTGLAHVMTYDLPLARFLGRIRADVDWSSDDDLDRSPSQLAQHRAVVFGGHSEYWTTRMYDAVEAARNDGVNVAFLGANPVYWQARLEPDAAGRDRRRVIVYRTTGEDPEAAGDPLAATVRWQDDPLFRNEAELVGLTYSAANVHGGYLVTDAPGWMLAGTGLSNGHGLPDAAANEVDTLDGVRLGQNAPNVQRVMAGTWADRSNRQGSFAATYYTTPAGAAVFAAGTTAWPCDLDQTCPFGGPRVSARTARAMRVLTENVLRGLTTPGFTRAHRSRASASTTPSALRARTPRRLRGFRGRRTVGGLDDD